jgi:hypothetical protein
MPIIAKAGPSGELFEAAPAGLHQAVCVDVVDMGILKVTYGGKEKEQWKIRLVWQLDELMKDGRPYLAQKRYTNSLHEKATLRKELESWRSRQFTQEELEGFDLEKLIGANAQINIQQVTKNGQTYGNVVSIVPLGRGMQKIEPKAYVRVKDRDAAGQVDDEPLTADDIPFAWIVPFILPLTALAFGVFA